MSEDIAISIENVSKAYRIWSDPSARLKSPLLDGMGQLLPSSSTNRSRIQAKAVSYYHDFYALKDLSFQVRRGESVGIIGRNGSGKSTLLQIIAGTLQPTTGSVRVNGRVAALLELGSGFNPEFTGRENIFLNGAVLGLSRTEVEAKFDEIASFADIGDFLEQPVRTYSSGMMMRLAFSVQTAVEPEILIVDEALSVGDASFVAKCIKRVSDFIQEGGTLLFVSHDIGLVKQLTSRALLLDKGQQLGYGDTVAVSLAYADSLTAGATTSVQDPDRYAATDAAYVLTDITTTRDGQSPVNTFQMGEAVVIIVNMRLGAPAPCRLVFSIYNYLGFIVCSGNYELPTPKDKEHQLQIQIHFPRLRLAPGTYRVNFSIRKEIEIVSWVRNATSFMVTGDTTETYIYREDTIASFSFA